MQHDLDSRRPKASGQDRGMRILLNGFERDRTPRTAPPVGALRFAPRQGGSFGAEPFARAGFRLGAILGAQFGQRLVQQGVAFARGFRDNVPFEALDLVHRRALSADQYARETVLGDRAVLPGGLAEQRHRGGLVLRRAGAVVERDGVFDLGIDIVGQRTGLQQPYRLVHALPAPGAFFAKAPERLLPFPIPPAPAHPHPPAPPFAILPPPLSSLYT